MLGFFNIPLNNKKLLETDICIFGIANDQGSRFKGARYSPNFLRRLSKCIYIGENRFLMDKSENTSGLKGFYNHAVGIKYMEGFTISDIGNIKLSNISEIFKTKKECCFPIAIGGDHAITFGIINAFNRGTIDTLFVMDAHEDYGNLNCRCVNGNVMSWIIEKDLVKNIYHYGIRGYSKHERKCRLINNINIFEILQSERKTCYISIDLDCLNPIYFSSVTVPVAGGIDIITLKNVIQSIYVHFDVMGVDIVEFLPKGQRRLFDGLAVLDLILFILELESIRNRKSIQC
jgi:agmatinase